MIICIYYIIILSYPKDDIGISHDKNKKNLGISRWIIFTMKKS